MSVDHVVGKFGKPPANRHIHKSQFHFSPNLYQTQYNKYGSVLHFDNMFLIPLSFFFFFNFTTIPQFFSELHLPELIQLHKYGKRPLYQKAHQLGSQDCTTQSTLVLHSNCGCAT